MKDKSSYLHKIVRVPAGVDVVQLLEVLSTSLFLVDAPHVLCAAPCELLLAQRLLRLCAHRRAIVNRHLTLHITPRRFCIKRDAFIVTDRPNPQIGAGASGRQTFRYPTKWLYALNDLYSNFDVKYAHVNSP
ncbi:hypothetical protein PUN28_005421 [Cardiocondyla obscurior]|uniref:Uncharacterized protein n=1 Tax=Cardiocondyla obscurior TaxID=286306 RepID=A0AAW2GHS3_9HYME